jgi:hypothetical protein
VMYTREEREGVTGRTTGGQRRVRVEGKTRGEEGRTREARACMCVRMHVSKKDLPCTATHWGQRSWAKYRDPEIFKGLAALNYE